MFMLSLCTKYWQILLAQAFCVGIGSGLLGLTSVAIIPLWFRKKRMIATGIAATGSSLGRQAVVVPISRSPKCLRLVFVAGILYLLME